jgi:light-harvesting protein B-800-850 alpha chain
MNQGRIWCVVNPSLGLPLFLGGVAAIALIVHASVLSNTNWMSHYWQGSARPARTGESGPAPAAVAAAAQPAAFSITVAPAAPGTAEGGFVITVTPSAGGAPSVVTTATPGSGQPALALADSARRSE